MSGFRLVLQVVIFLVYSRLFNVIPRSLLSENKSACLNSNEHEIKFPDLFSRRHRGSAAALSSAAGSAVEKSFLGIFICLCSETNLTINLEKFLASHFYQDEDLFS